MSEEQRRAVLDRAVAALRMVREEAEWLWRQSRKERWSGKVRPPEGHSIARAFDAADAAITEHKALTTTEASVGDGWRPIETAPKDGTLFLGFGGRRYTRVIRWTRWGWFDLAADEPCRGLTHWTPLLPAPDSTTEVSRG